MQQTCRQKIAFLADGFICWAGGVDFLRLCIAGIDSVVPNARWPILVPEPTVPQRALGLAIAAKRRLWELAGVRPAIDAPLSRDQLRDAIASTGSNFEIFPYPGNAAGLCRALSNLRADVVMPCFRSLRKEFPIKWIGYYGDLQHRMLPANFSRRDRRKREWEITTLLANATAIVVPSKSVADDVARFYPERRAALFPLPFCPPANPDFLRDASDDLLQGYELPEKFFLVSNQFWIHKSHETAFSALRLVRDAGFEDVHILCTGNTHDFRAPGHFERLEHEIAREGMDDRIRFMGMLPKRLQLAIMRRSIALLQPTLFEGGPGGLATFDAVSTATPAIISDIEVNREVDLGVIEFFRAGSAEDLASKMLSALRNPPRRLSADDTLAMLRQRQRKLGETLLEAVSYVCGEAAMR